MVPAPLLASVAAILLVFAGGGMMAAEPSVPDGGTALVTMDLPALVKGDGFRSPAGSIRRVAASGAPFAEAVRVQATAQAKNPWEVQLNTRLVAPIARRDACLLELWLRAVEDIGAAGEVVVDAVIQKASPDWDQVFAQRLSAGREWKRFLIPFHPGRDHRADEAQLALQCARQVQVLELGGLRLLNFGSGRALADLPRTRITYAGMEADAPWRAAAERRIDQMRKGDLTVRVVDAAGRPKAGVAVRAVMKRHAFPWGSAVTARRILGKDADDETYRRTVTGLFNRVVMENDLKWGAWAGEWGPAYGREQTLAAIDWLRGQGLAVRGHCLVWPSWRNLPKAVAALKGDVPALRQRILDRIDDAAAATGARCCEWDVLNEPFDNHDVQDLAGRDVMVEWFRRARDRMPRSCRLFINDYDNLESGDPDSRHSRFYQDTIRFLLDQGAPVEGIGLQGHFGSAVAPERLLQVLDRFAAFRLPLAVTEFDFNTDDEELQAAFMRDMLTVAFSHPAVDSFLFWGFWAKAHWLPKGALFRADWSERPAAGVYRDLVLKRWWTTAEGTTAADGTWMVRGFRGDYAITVDGKAVTGTIGTDATTVTVLVR